MVRCFVSTLLVALLLAPSTLAVSTDSQKRTQLLQQASATLRLRTASSRTKAQTSKQARWGVGSWFGGVVDSATHAVSTAASDVGDVVTSVSKDVAHTIKAGVNDAEQAASDVVDDAGALVKGAEDAVGNGEQVVENAVTAAVNAAVGAGAKMGIDLHVAQTINSATDDAVNGAQSAVVSGTNKAISDVKGAVKTVDDKTNDATQKAAKALDHAADVIKGVANEVSKGANMTGDLLTGVANEVRDIGLCLHTLPGGAMSPQEALQKIGAALERDEIVQYIFNTYARPMFTRAVDDLEKLLLIAEAEADALAGSLVKDGKLDVSALEGLPEQAVGLIEKLADVDPTVSCLVTPVEGVEGLLSTAVDDLGPLIGDTIKEVLGKIDALWTKLTGPDSWLGKVVKALVGDIVGGFQDYVNEADKIDNIVGNAMTAACQTGMSDMLGYMKDLKAPTGFCDVASGSELQLVSSDSVKKSLVAALDWVTRKVGSELEVHVWRPLLAELTTLVLSAKSSIHQLVVGLCGLIPEAGGPICMAVAEVITPITSELIKLLTSSSVQGLVTDAEHWVESKIPAWSDELADLISPLLTAGVEDIENLATEVEKSLAKVINGANNDAANALSEVEADVSGLLEPITTLITPFMAKFLASSFPKIIQAYGTCKGDIGALASVLRSSVHLCPVGGGECFQQADNQKCTGLTADKSGDTSSAMCAKQCCKDNTCAVWNWNESLGCWRGVPAGKCDARHDGWVGGKKN